ncbi:hypothetical protein ACJX0J_034124, partial [Zea mays]
LPLQQIAEVEHYTKDLKYPRGSLVYGGDDEDDFLYCLPDKERADVLAVEGVELRSANAVLEENNMELASTDAKRIIDEERANARLEIGRAKASVQKIQSALKEQEKFSHRTGKQDVDELKEEVQEAPRVKMLHCPSKAMDIENEIQVLCDQLAKTSSYSLRLLKVLELHRSYGENDMPLYELKGLETLGSTLHIVVHDCASVDFWNSTTKPAYAPEPHDVGRYTQAEVKSGGQTSITKTAGSVHPGLVHYVEALVRRRETGYDVVILQVNGVAQAADSVHILCIGRLQMRLAKEKTIIVKEFYST